MKLASYHGTRSGLMGLGNAAIRLRLRGKFSHTEIMFEPGDGVDHMMPDGTCAPDANGAYWMASSVWLERIPVWSRRRAGRFGGWRMKRITPDPRKWTLDEVKSDPIVAASIARENEGSLYDWQLVLQFIGWIIPQKMSRGHCAEAAARMLGIPAKDAWRFDPCSLPAAVKALHEPSEAPARSWL